ncbi:9390_t:CDS:2 [Paraglomus brasilianum]|uniref:9390_t:CDS:1 n=1 Tax=Paraglomus brasilianum TaxID=144538 RepID=A0A9N9GSN2_9GLOM|nr:9390_t:CDS:2 [Paraglomus brasilianum]
MNFQPSKMNFQPSKNFIQKLKHKSQVFLQHFLSPPPSQACQEPTLLRSIRFVTVLTGRVSDTTLPNGIYTAAFSISDCLRFFGQSGTSGFNRAGQTNPYYRRKSPANLLRIGLDAVKFTMDIGKYRKQYGPTLVFMEEKWSGELAVCQMNRIDLDDSA